LRYAYRGIAFDYTKEIVGGSDFAYRGIAFDVDPAISKGGVDYSVWNREFVRWSLVTNHKRHVGYGLLAARNASSKSRYMRVLKLDLGTKAERDKLRRRRCCPQCGSQIESNYDRVTLDFAEGRAMHVELLRRRNQDETLLWRDSGFVPY
jgi:hypothetical protein